VIVVVFRRAYASWMGAGATAKELRGMRLRVAGTALLLLAVLMFIGSFVAASKTPIEPCHPGIPCPLAPRITDRSHRQEVFFLWIGATLIVFVGGIVLRSAAIGVAATDTGEVTAPPRRSMI
jgi:hypothetical protein